MIIHNLFYFFLSIVKLINEDYFKKKLEQTIEFLKKEFINKDNFLDLLLMLIVREKKENIMFMIMQKLKILENIDNYFELDPKGNWENKTILVEKKIPPKEIIDKLLKIRSNKKKPFFDSKTQLDLNCLWISALISAHDILPKNNYLKLAEDFYSRSRKKIY